MILKNIMKTLFFGKLGLGYLEKVLTKISSCCSFESVLFFSCRTASTPNPETALLAWTRSECES